VNVAGAWVIQNARVGSSSSARRCAEARLGTTLLSAVSATMRAVVSATDREYREVIA
jgi:hypothetical protein